MRRINPLELQVVKELLEKEYNPAIGFLAEDPVFVGCVLYLKDKAAGITLQNAVRKIMPKPCEECKKEKDHDCPYQRIVSRGAKRVTALRLKLHNR